MWVPPGWPWPHAGKGSKNNPSSARGSISDLIDATCQFGITVQKPAGMGHICKFELKMFYVSNKLFHVMISDGNFTLPMKLANEFTDVTFPSRISDL